MRTNREKHVEIVEELNELNGKLRKRVNRCHYLHRRMKEMVRCRNREQAQAYTCRINWHKPKILTMLERIEELESLLGDVDGGRSPAYPNGT